MKSLFRLFMWRHQRRNLFRAFLGLASISLGVALYVSVHVAQASTIHAFEESARRMAGKAELRVSRGRQAGIEASALERIERIEGVTAAPVLRKSTTFPDLESSPVLILGVDFARERNFREYSFGETKINPFLMNDRAILVTRTFASRHELSIGSPLRMHTPTGIRPVHVAGLIDESGPAEVFGGNLALMGIRGAQTLFAADGRLDRIDAYPASAAEAIRAELGPEFRVEPVQATSSIMEEVLGRVRGLVAVSVIAMMVGLFIIYLSVSIGVVERAKEVGTLRALGGSRSQILTLFLTEAGILGVLGSVLGMLLGIGMASALIDYTAQWVNMMSFQIHVDEMVFPAWAAAVAIAGGTLVSILAALVPALRATAISPIEILRPASLGGGRRESHRLGFGVGVALFLASTYGILFLYFQVPEWAGLALTATVLLGTALMLPQITLWISRLCRRPLRSLYRIEGYLAADNVMKYPERTALTVVALGGALSIMVTSASIFASFQKSGERWIEEALPWDLSVQATDLNDGFASDARFPREVLDRVRKVDGVASVLPIQAVLQEYGRQDVMLLVADMKAYMEMLREAGSDRKDFNVDAPHMEEVYRGEAIGVSSSFMRVHGIGVGEPIQLRTPAGLRNFKVAYNEDSMAWPQGVIFMDLGIYRELWGDTSLRYIDLRVEPGRDIAEVKAALGKVLEGEYRAFVYTKADLEEIAQVMMDESFRLTHVQALVAMIIGFLGIVNTLLISVLRRTREIGLLRAVGMTRRQVARTVVIESTFVAFVGGVFGLIAGLFAAAFPISMHVLRTTGFELGFVVPWTALGVALGASVLLGMAAAYLPARRAAGLNLLEAIGYE